MEDEQLHPQDYFRLTDIEKRMSELSDEAMLQLLFNLEQSEFWVAILRYNQQRLSQSQSAIFTADPVKDPTMIARHQGIMLGLSDLQNAVIMLTQQHQQAAKEAEKVKKEKKD